MGFIKKENATIFLVINAVLWGSSYVWSKMLLAYIPRFSILFLCALGSLFTTVVIFPGKLKGIKSSVILPALAVSLLSIVSNTFFMLALQYTSSSNTAFIVQTSVILAPLMMAVIEHKRLSGRTFGSAAAALGGIFLITWDFKGFAFNPGDLLAFCNALFFTAFLVGLKTLCGKTDPVHFSLIHQTTNTIGFFSLALFFESGKIEISGLAGIAFPLLILVSTAVAASTVLLQSAAIKFVRPEKATLVYTLEPVAALLLAAVFMGEKPEGFGPAVGCVVILAAVMWSVYRPRRRKSERPQGRTAKRVYQYNDIN